MVNIDIMMNQFINLQIIKNNIPETYLTNNTEVKKDENVHTEIILSEFLIGENNG